MFYGNQVKGRCACVLTRSVLACKQTARRLRLPGKPWTKWRQICMCNTDQALERLPKMVKTFLRPTEEAYAELQKAYDFYNDNLFAMHVRLPACMITFQREKRTMGYYSQGRFIRSDGIKADEIAMNPDYFAVIPLVEILQTLVHEMVHLWQANFGKPSRPGYHNTEWARKMEAIGLMPSDTGQPGGNKVGQSMNDYLIQGGRFDKATRRLLSAGFAISWMDRFPVHLRSAVIPLHGVVVSTTGQAALSRGEGCSEVENEIVTVQIESQSIGEENQFSTPMIAAAYQVPTGGGLDIAIRETGDRSNRAKYSCPTCKVNVWGKPGLGITCKPCDTEFIAS
ncbi:SprT-like domain-containing protein [Pseudomonas sp. AB12(2023)]|uniref:SprT-like domain-containing protein n=1 Tax=Pseudomonas sp. AB12(2023) TaxID=3048597 RepID=UPI002B23E2E7|nr:SprT-like domain-containing protein [Pseudomonas sp. AB12(2023)]MEB0221353.1 SprT-like domain-containing protein [Pseudomonas sp. AB12(2023)]